MSNEGLKSMIVNAQFDPNLATKKLARIRESMYSTKVDQQNTTTHIYRFDGTLADFSFNRKLNLNHQLSENFLTLTIQESPLDYSDIYKFERGKRHLFTFSDIVSNSDIFKFVLLFYVDGQLYIGEINSAHPKGNFIPGVLFLFTENTITICFDPEDNYDSSTRWSLLMIPNMDCYSRKTHLKDLFRVSDNTFNYSSFTHINNDIYKTNNYTLLFGIKDSHRLHSIKGCKNNSSRLLGLPYKWTTLNPTYVNNMDIVDIYVMNSNNLHYTQRCVVTANSDVVIKIDSPIPMNSILIWKQSTEPTDSFKLMTIDVDYEISFKYPNIYVVTFKEAGTFLFEYYSTNENEWEDNNPIGSAPFYNEFKEFELCEPLTYKENMYYGDVPDVILSYDINNKRNIYDDNYSNYVNDNLLKHFEYYHTDLFKLYLINKYGWHNPKEVIDYFESAYDIYYGLQYHKWFIKVCESSLNDRSVNDNSIHADEDRGSIRIFSEPCTYLDVRVTTRKNINVRLWIDGVHYDSLFTYRNQWDVYVYIPRSYIDFNKSIIEVEVIEGSDQFIKELDFDQSSTYAQIGNEDGKSEFTVARPADIMYISTDDEDNKSIIYNAPFSSSTTNLSFEIRQYHSIMEYYKDRFYIQQGSKITPETAIDTTKMNDEGVRHLKRYMTDNVSDGVISDYWNDSSLPKYPKDTNPSDSERYTYFGDVNLAYNFGVKPLPISKFRLHNINESNLTLHAVNIANLASTRASIDIETLNPYTHDELHEIFKHKDINEVRHDILGSRDAIDISDICSLTLEIPDPLDSTKTPISNYSNHYAYFVGGRRVFPGVGNRYRIISPVNDKNEQTQIGGMALFKASPITSLMDNNEISILHLPYAERIVCHLDKIPNVARPTITSRRNYAFKSKLNPNDFLNNIKIVPYAFPSSNDHCKIMYDGEYLSFKLIFGGGAGDYTHDGLSAFSHQYMNALNMTHDSSPSEHPTTIEINEFKIEKHFEIDETTGNRMCYYKILGYHDLFDYPVYLYHIHSKWNPSASAWDFLYCSFNDNHEDSKFYFEDMNPSGKEDDGETTYDPVKVNPTTGLIDFMNIPGSLTCPLSRPFSLKYYDLYLNGKKLNEDNVHILSETVIQLVNINSDGSLFVIEKYVNPSEDKNIFDVISPPNTKRYLTSYNDMLLRSSEEYFNYKVENYYIENPEIDLYANLPYYGRGLLYTSINSEDHALFGYESASYGKFHGLTMKDNGDEGLDVNRVYNDYEFENILVTLYDNDEEAEEDKEKLPTISVQAIKEGIISI